MAHESGGLDHDRGLDAPPSAAADCDGLRPATRDAASEVGLQSGYSRLERITLS